MNEFKLKAKLKYRVTEEKGYTFAFTVGVVLILLIVGGALLTLVINEMNMLVHHYDTRRAYYLAEAGINHALWELNQNPVGDGVTSGTLQVGSGTGTYSTTYSQSVLTSTGTYPSSGGVTKTITVKVAELTTGGGFGNTAAIFAGEINTVPAKTTVWNGLGDTQPNRVTIVNTKNNTLTVNGYVLNYNQAFAGAEYLGWAYSTGNVGPAANVGTHFRRTTTDPGYLFPIFNSTNYDNMIANPTGTVLNSPLTGTQILSAGTYYRADNLTISNATIQTDNTATRANPVYIVVTGRLTVTSSTIGVSNPTTLADPTQPPSSSNPYGNWIRILVGVDTDISGTIGSRTNLNKEVRLYTKDEDLLIKDYVTMNQGGIFTSDEGKLGTGGGGQTASTWLAQVSNTNDALYDVSFADLSKGIAVGTGGVTGVIRYTVNGGNTWSAPSSLPGGAPPLFGVSFPTASSAWAVGGSGNIWKSLDGGDSWTSQTSNTSQTLNGVSFANTSAGIAVGNNGTIRYTTNGGSSWLTPTSVPGGSPDLKAVSMPTSSSAWVVGAAGTIWKTADGGQTWTAQSSGTSQNLTGTSFVDINNGWVVGANGTILRTTNGGTNWSSQNADNYGGNLQAIRAFNTYQALTVGTYANSTSSLHTTNGGYTWDSQTMPASFNSTLYGASFVNQLNGWAVGASGKILKYTGPTIYLRGTILTKDEFELKVNPSGGEIWVEGAVVAGYRYEDPSNPGSFISSPAGEIKFQVEGSGGHLEDAMFNQGAMPESPDDGIGVTTGASLIYSTWREK